jgi:hypothetical protein
VSAPTPVVGIVAPARSGPGSRRRAWLRAGCVFLVVLIYLCWWTTYAVNGLSAYGRYRQLEPGAPAAAMGAEFRLTSLVQTSRLVNSITDEISSPPANTVWLVARIEVVRRTESELFLCSFSVLGPERRIWEKDSGFVSRDTDSFCDEASAPLGQPIQVEAVFQVPVRYVDQLAGVVVDDATSREARQVLVPPR